MENKLKNIIIICLVIIIILLLVTRCEKLNNTRETGSGDIQEAGSDNIQETGNVTVFDINVNVNYTENILDENGNIIDTEKQDTPFDEDENKNSNEPKKNNTESNGSQPKDTGGNSGSNGSDGQQGATTNSGEIAGENSNEIAESSESIEQTITDRKGYEVPVYSPDEDEEETGKVFVYDKNGDFLYQQTLDIFKNSAFKNNNIIAPGSSNVYEFVVKNSSKKNAGYYLEMKEITEYPINIKYRLKCNGVFVVGDKDHWVTANELKTQYKTLKAGKSDNYSLDWCWFHDDENDTFVGSNMTSEYQLNVDIYFSMDN